MIKHYIPKTAEEKYQEAWNCIDKLMNTGQTQLPERLEVKYVAICILVREHVWFHISDKAYKSVIRQLTQDEQRQVKEFREKNDIKLRQRFIDSFDKPILG